MKSQSCLSKTTSHLLLVLGIGVLLSLPYPRIHAGPSPSSTTPAPPRGLTLPIPGGATRVWVVSPTITLTTIPTPTLPSRLTLLTPAFALPAASASLTLTVRYDQFEDIGPPLLAYRATPACPWRRIPVRVDVEAQQFVVIGAPPGEYALVKLNVAADALPGNAVVVDDMDSGFTRYGPSANWHEATDPEDYYDGHAYWTYNTYDTVENWGVWTPPALDGNYEVFVFVPANYASTTNAYYYVQHNGQLDGESIDQSTKWAEWVSLGVYDFTSGTDSYVKLTDVTYESYASQWIAFDAVAFVPNEVYLPLVMHNYPPPPPKLHTGIHLGNRTGDWSLDMLQPIDGDKGGSWPKAVVVLSDQIWHIERSTTSPCSIIDAQPRPDRPVVYDYLKRAAQNDVQVIIRIYPSPGNFIDWDDPGHQSHHLRFDSVPAGDNYCWSEDWPESPAKPYGYQYFRSITDISDEMGNIHASNVADGWTEAGFEPANEPNIESGIMTILYRRYITRKRGTRWMATSLPCTRTSTATTPA